MGLICIIGLCLYNGGKVRTGSKTHTKQHNYRPESDIGGLGMRVCLREPNLESIVACRWRHIPLVPFSVYNPRDLKQIELNPENLLLFFGRC